MSHQNGLNCEIESLKREKKITEIHFRNVKLGAVVEWKRWKNISDIMCQSCVSYEISKLSYMQQKNDAYGFKWLEEMCQSQMWQWLNIRFLLDFELTKWKRFFFCCYVALESDSDYYSEFWIILIKRVKLWAEGKLMKILYRSSRHLIQSNPCAYHMFPFFQVKKFRYTWLEPKLQIFMFVIFDPCLIFQIKSLWIWTASMHAKT